MSSSISVSALYPLFNSLHDPSTTVLLHSLHGFRNSPKKELTQLLLCVQDADRPKLQHMSYAAMVIPGRGNRSWNCQSDVLALTLAEGTSSLTNIMEWH